MDWADELVEGNAEFARREWDAAAASLEARPSRKLAILACIDSRFSIHAALGLKPGEAKVIRTAGPRLDRGASRSLVVCTHALGVERVAVIGHTTCGMRALAHDVPGFARKIQEATGHDPFEVTQKPFDEWLGAIDDIDANVRTTMQAIRDHPLIGKVELAGFVFKHDTGTLRRVE